MIPQLQVASGSVTGRYHVLNGKGNQDAAYWRATEDRLVAVVCDGCSAGEHNAAGAVLGARMLVEAIHRLLEQVPAASMQESLELARCAVLAELRSLLEALGGTHAEVVAEYLSFTV